MSAVAEPVADALAGDRLARRNALVLAIAQSLAGGNNTVLVATAAIVGTMLAPDKGLATLPISIFVLGMWMGTLPMGMLARRLGRRNALQIGTGCGVLTGLICCVAVLQGSFFLFNVGAVFSGFYASAHQSYRFAAADTASDEFRPKAISWVLFGGILAGVVGAQLVIATQNLWPPYLFAATYIGQSALALVAGGVLMFVNIPKPPPRSVVGDGRPLSEIAREPRFIVAVACGVAAYSMMNLVMTSAPLAMVMCNHSITDATLGLQWHVLQRAYPLFQARNAQNGLAGNEPGNR
jgi:MFS family permease